jgi:hypothetical protein
MKVVSQCQYCKHLAGCEPGRGWTCSAFPDDVPDEVYYNRHDHRRPYPGDHGTRWEPASEERGRLWEELVRDWEETHGRKWGEAEGQS